MNKLYVQFTQAVYSVIARELRRTCLKMLVSLWNGALRCRKWEATRTRHNFRGDSLMMADGQDHQHEPIIRQAINLPNTRNAGWHLHDD